MKTNWKFIILLALAVTAVAGYVVDALQEGTSQPRTELQDGFERVPTQEVPEQEPVENVSKQVRASAAGWSPARINVTSGDRVTLHLRSTDGNTYVFSLPAYGISQSFSSTPANISFLARTPGEWEFYNAHPSTPGIRGAVVISE